MYQQYKDEIEKVMRNQSALLVSDIQKQGYGIMTGSMIVIAFDSAEEELFKELAPNVSEMGSTESELRAFLHEMTTKILKEYVDLRV